MLKGVGGSKFYVSDFPLLLSDESPSSPESKMGSMTSQLEAAEILQQFEFRQNRAILTRI